MVQWQFFLLLLVVTGVVIIFFGLLHRVNVTEDGKKALVTLANGDMRKVLNILQVVYVLNCFTILYSTREC